MTDSFTRQKEWGFWQTLCMVGVNYWLYKNTSKGKGTTNITRPIKGFYESALYHWFKSQNLFFLNPALSHPVQSNQPLPFKSDKQVQVKASQVHLMPLPSNILHNNWKIVFVYEHIYTANLNYPTKTNLILWAQRLISYSNRAAPHCLSL